MIMPSAQEMKKCQFGTDFLKIKGSFEPVIPFIYE